MSLSKSKLMSYEEYLNTLTKKELTTFLDSLEIEYSCKAKTSGLVKLVLDELEDIIYKVLDYFTFDQYQMMKSIIKQNGNIKIKKDASLIQFCNYLTKHHLMYKHEDKKYEVFNEVQYIIKNKIKQKKIIKKCKKNSNEFKLIIGTTLVYGAINLKKFYAIYSEKYEMTEMGLKEYLISLKKYTESFKIYEEKNNTYLANNIITNIKQCKNYAEKKGFKKYNASEIQDIYTLKYMKKYKSYRKLRKFIKNSYYVENDNFKIVIECILNPFLQEYQINKQKANQLLDKLFDDYFEFNSKKHKDKFIDLVNELAKDYPNWNLSGYSEKEKLK